MDIPQSSEVSSVSPEESARRIVRRAAMKAATASATFSVPGGPVAWATILPDLLSVWHIQRQMVADIAALFGKTEVLTKEAMVYCLFKQGAGALARDMVTRFGTRYLVREASLSTMQAVLKKIGVKVTQKSVSQFVSKSIPFVASALMGGYSYYDTKKVGENAIEIFSSEIYVEKKITEEDSLEEDEEHELILRDSNSSVSTDENQ